VLAKELEAVATIHVTHGMSIVSVVGESLRTTAGVAARIFTALRDINVRFITHSGATTNLSLVVEDARVNDAIVALHAQLFEKERMPS